MLPIFDSVLKQQGKKANVVNTRANNYTSEDNVLLERFFVSHANQKRLTVPLHNANESKMTNKQKKKLTEELSSLVKKII